MRRKALSIILGITVVAAMAIGGCGGGGGDGGGGSSSDTAPQVSTGGTTATTVTPSVTSVASGPFPIGTWVGPRGASFTVSKLYSGTSLLNNYTGTITFPAFGTVNVSGTEMPVSSGSNTYSSLILLGSNFAVNANVFNSSGTTTMFYFTSDEADNRTIQTLTKITGNLIVTSTTPANAVPIEKVTFVKQ
jgi:hypothetical protein